MIDLVQPLNAAAPVWAGAIWRAVWQGGLAIGVVWVVCSFFPRIPGRVRCWLWRLAFVKLMICLFWVSPVKLALLPAPKPAPPAAVVQREQRPPVISSPDGGSGRAATTPTPSEAQGRRNQSVTETGSFLQGTRPSPATVASEVSSRRIFWKTFAGWISQRPGLAATVALALWALGVLAGVIVLIYRGWQVQLLVRGGRKLESEPTRLILASLVKQFGHGTVPEVRVTGAIRTPLLAGFRKPVILMPDSFLRDQSPAQLKMMMAHELAHLKRRDLWWAWLVVAGQILFFFHPLVWLARRESRLAEEMAADDLAVTVCQLKPADYAGMLVEVAAGWSPLPGGELAVGIVGSHKTLKRRLEAMKHISFKSNRRIMLAALAVSATGAGVIVPWQIVAQDVAQPQAIQICQATPVKSGGGSGGGSISSQLFRVGPVQSGAQMTVTADIDSKSEPVITVFVDTDGRYHLANHAWELNDIVKYLEHAANTDPKPRIAIQAAQSAPMKRLIALLDKINGAGLGKVSIATVPNDTGVPQTLDLAFGVWRPEESKQTGPAAAGREGDYWNTVGVAWNNDHTESGLKFASGEPSPVHVRMINLAGGWGNNGLMGVKAPMYDSYNYPVNNQGGDARVVLSQVPPGKYDIYIYGHEKYPVAYGDYTLTVGGHNYGRKTTSNQKDAIENTSWVEGSQYVKFPQVTVGTDAKLEIRIQPGGQVTDEYSRTFTDATINGLQLIPVE